MLYEWDLIIEVVGSDGPLLLRKAHRTPMPPFVGLNVVDPFADGHAEENIINHIGWIVRTGRLQCWGAEIEDRSVVAEELAAPYRSIGYSDCD